MSSNVPAFDRPEVVGAAVLGLVACAYVASGVFSKQDTTRSDPLRVCFGLCNLTQQEGNYKPVKTEVEATNLSLLEGSIPESLDGMFIRNGPNPFEIDPRFHWFEGWGMVNTC